MNRHLPLAYVLAGLESVVGTLLILGAVLLGQSILRDTRHARLDDWIALSGLATAAAGVTASGAAAMLHRVLCYGTLRRVRLAAAISEGCLIFAGIGMWLTARQRGGDWAGMGIMGGIAFMFVGIVLLVVTGAGMWIVRERESVGA